MVVARVTALLENQNISFATDQLSYNLLELSTDLRHVRVTTALPGAPPFLEIDDVRIDLSLWQVLRGRYVVQSGRADGLRIHYFVDANGIDNLPRPPSDPNQPARPLDYLIAQFDVPNATVRYENRAQGIDITLPRASLAMKGYSISGRHDVTLDAVGGEARLNDRSAHLDRVAAALDLGRDDVRIERAEIVAEGAQLNANGAVGPFQQPTLNVVVQATIDLARAVEVAKVQESVSGQLFIDGDVTGPVTALTFNGQLKGTDLQARELHDMSLDAVGTFDAAAQHVQLSRLHIAGPAGTVRGTGKVALTGNRQSAVDAAVEALNAELLMRALHMPYRIASTVKGQVRANWPGVQYQHARGQASLTLTPTRRVAAMSTVPVRGRIDVSGDGGRVLASLRNIGAGGAVANAQLTIRDWQRLDGRIEARAADAQTTLNTIEVVLGRPHGSLVPVTVSGAASVNARIGGSVTAPTVEAAVGAPALALGDASGIAVEADLAYRPNAVAINRLDVMWQDARATARGSVELAGRQALDVAIVAERLDVHGLLGVLEQGDTPLTGSLSANVHVGGTAKLPIAALRIQGVNLVAYNEALGSLSASGSFANRQLDINAARLDKPQPDGNGRITATGSYHLDSKQIVADLQSDNVKLLTLTLPDGRAVRGAVAASAKVSGTLTNPAGAAKLQATDLVVGAYDIGGIVADATLADSRATVVAAAPRFATTANAAIGIARPYLATVSARIGDLDLAALPVKLQTPLEGRLQAQLQAEGPLIDMQSGRASATVEAFRGRWNEKPFAIDGPARFRYTDERLTIDRLDLTADDSTVSISGNLPLVDSAAPGSITIDAHANLATLAQYAPQGSNISADGRLTIKGTVQGTLKAIDPNLAISLEDALILSPAMEPGVSNLNASAAVANGEAVINQMTATWGSAQLGATARVPLDLLPELPVQIPRRAGPATIHARLDGLDPGAVPGVPAGVSGRISLDAEITSTQPDFRDAEGRIAFRDLQIGINGLTLEQQAPSLIRVSNGVAAIQSLSLAGSVGTLAATGTVSLTDERAIDLKVDGGMNIAALALITDAVRAEGDSTITLAASGTIADPIVTGNITLRDGAVAMDEPTIVAEAVNARIAIDRNRVAISALTAAVNGGTMTGKGGFLIGAAGITDVDISLETRDFAFDAPLDLRSLSDADIRIRSTDADVVIGGQITIQEAGLTGDINFDTGLLASVTARRQLELTPQRNPLLERVLFDVNVDTSTPVLVDNNLAKAEVTADLRIVGTPYEIGLLGRLDVAEGGMVTLNERTFEIERGRMTFLEDRRIFPSFDLLMNTSVNNYDITLSVSGEPGNTETTLTSNPPLPEPDIMATIVTGRTLDQMRGEEYDVAREQVLSYLTGRVGSTIGRGLERATGLSEVRIEPQLIANEADPGARLTLGQDITDDLTLTYSVDLADSDDQIWLATYDITRRFQTRAVRQNDNSYRVDFRHDIRKGGTPEPRRTRRVRPKISTVTVPDDAPIPAAELRQLLSADEGDDFDYFAARNGTEDIEKRLREMGWAQSRVRLDRVIDTGGVALSLRITRGPQVEFRYSGATPPRSIQEDVRLQWHRGVFDAQRTDDVSETVLEWLMRDDYLQAKVVAKVRDSDPQQRRVQIDVTPGPRSRTVLLTFEGASGIPPKELDQVVDEQKLERQLFTDPAVVIELLQRFYREQGYLNIDIDRPRYEFSGDTARVVLPIREGARFEVATVTVTGNSAIDTPSLQLQLPVVNGEPFMPVAAENALQHIRGLYWAQGYNEVRVAYQLAIDRERGLTGVEFQVREGRQAVVSEIRIAGNDRTSERLVREQVIVKPNEPLNLQALSRSRKNLYDSGAFSIVDLSRDTVVEAPENSLVGALAGLTPSQKPVIVEVDVREVQPYQLRYGASYDTEGQLGGVFDASLHNVLGKARVLGLSARYDTQLREGRLFMTQPTLRHWPVQTTASIYYTEERNPGTTLTDAFNVDRKGASIQQEQKLKNAYVWTYGYRFERARTFDPLFDLAREQLTKVSPLSSAFVRDTRDEVLDATRGSFSSQSFSFSPTWLGSDDTYVRYFGQYFHYFPLQREYRKRFSNEIIRPRFVFATGARVGVSKGLGSSVPTSERFFAGGSTTLRGFEQNAVGPVGPTGVVLGGDAMFVLNNELRMPLFSLIDGVGFVDIGNVWLRTTPFSWADLRKTAGLGLRVRTKWVLVRSDYGWILDRRNGDPRGRFYFSIGQAF